MSHYTLLVLSHSPQEIETLLEPYNEALDDEPRWALVASSPGEWWATKSLIQSGKLTGEPSWQEAIDAYNSVYPEEPLTLAGPDHEPSPEDVEEQVSKIEDGKLYTVTTYNQLSKWDWYQIGGRWSDMLLLKEGHSGNRGSRSWVSESEPAIEGRCDQALKGDLDLEGMRSEAGMAAEVRWDKYDALRLWHGEPDTGWLEDLRSGDPDRLVRGEEGRAAYHRHPLITAAKDEGLIGLLDLGTEEFKPSREDYVDRARMRAITGYATLDGLSPDSKHGTPGTWIEQGKMGWFGMDDSTPDSELAYLVAANAAIDAAPDDTWITLIDLHI